jgi:drug/metabolite transporter (DMT)-like permease
VGILGRLKNFQERNALKIAWGCTISGVLCTGWIAPCFKLLGNEGVAPGRRASWRSQVLLLLLLIPALFEYRTLTPQQKRDLFNRRTLLQLLLCGILWFFDLFLWSNALDYTTVSRSSIFASTASLMIMVYSLIRRQPISGLEIAGGIIGFSGLVFAVVGTNIFFASESEQHAKSPLKGDILSLASAACVAAYVLNATKVRAKVSVFIYTTSNTCILIFALSAASFIMEGTKLDASTDGIFGWASPQFLLVVALLSVVAGMIGFNLNNVALRYMPPLGYTLMALCDPFISGTYAWMIGADGIPGIFTFAGGVITIGGIVVLIVGQEKRKQKEKLAAEEKASLPKVTDFVVSDGTEV